MPKEFCLVCNRLRKCDHEYLCKDCAPMVRFLHSLSMLGLMMQILQHPERLLSHRYFNG